MKVFKSVIDLFSKAFIAAKAPEPAMTAEERGVIIELAKGDLTRRAEAIAIHRAHISDIGVRGDVFQCYMAEVDTTVPDYIQRKAYRDAVLQAA